MFLRNTLERLLTSATLRLIAPVQCAPSRSSLHYAAALSDVVVGLVPFQKGARILLNASNVAVTDLDTDSDLTLIWLYVL